MPDVNGVRKLLPLVIWSDNWQHCGKRGITIDKALGKSQWKLLAECNACKRRLVISKNGILVEKGKSDDTDQQHDRVNPSREVQRTRGQGA